MNYTKITTPLQKILSKENLEKLEKFTIHYNPLTWETEIKSNNRTILSNLQNYIVDIKNRDITVWIDSFVEKVSEELNDDPFHLTINSCFESDKSIIENKLKNRKVQLDIKSVDSDKLFKRIDESIKTILEDSSFDVNTVNQRKDEIHKLQSTVIEIPVIATMSSGKSTILNALIGQTLLPALNRATTATTCKIVINNELNNFKGQILNNGIVITEENNITEDFVKQHNDKANTEDLEIIIEGAVPTLNTKGFEVHFLDTPGPNNTQNEKHKKSTYEYLKDNTNLPIILYVLNATQLAIDDDKELLEEISKVFEDNKENLDRIIFLANKIDAFDVEKESIDACIENIKDYLGKFNIKNPKIFPISGEYARLSQTNEKKRSRTENNNFSTFRKNFIYLDDTYKGYELVKHSPLREDQKEYLLAESKKNEIQKDLVYSGLAAVRLYIEEYIESHHKKNVYKDLCEIINDITNASISNLELEKKNLREKSQEEKEAIAQERKAQEKKLENDKKQLADKIKSIKIDKKVFKNEALRIDNEVNLVYSKASKHNKVTPETANKLRKDFDKQISNLKISIGTTLQATAQEIIQNHLNELKEVTKIILIDDKENQSVETAAFNATLINSIGSISDKSLSAYTYIETETKSRTVTKTVKNNKSLWSKFWDWDWSDTKTVEEKEYYTVEHKTIMFNTFYENEIKPILNKIRENIKNYEKQLDGKIENLNIHYLQKIDDYTKSILDEIYSESNKKASRTKEEMEKEEQALNQKIKDFKNFTQYENL